MNRTATGAVAVCLALLTLGSREASAVELREWIKDRGVAESGRTLPDGAAEAFVYEGTPYAVRVTDAGLAVDYGNSGVLFDRARGEPLRRWSVLDGWPQRRPDEFPPYSPTWRPRQRLLGPGVLNPSLPPHEVPRDAAEPATVCEAGFAGKAWRAVQPKRFLNQVKGWDRRSHEIAWSAILHDLDRASYVEASGELGATRRYTTADGLASNIVTHLASHDGLLWAACVDIYDAEKEAWGPGGLCVYDAKADRWQRLAKIDGRDVRFVTLMQVNGDELWVGFREGDGVEDDRVAFGMGLYPGIYRPRTTALVLARLAKGKWTTWSRAPRSDAWYATNRGQSRQSSGPTEFPFSLARFGDRAMLFTLADAHQATGNWENRLSGFVSLLELTTSQWRDCDTYRDTGADELFEMIAQHGEILVTSNLGVHRYQADRDTWQFLDPGCTLMNPEFQTGAVVADELWLGYDRQSFGVLGRQGISRYSEKTGRWTHMTPDELGTGSPIRRISVLDNGEVWVLFASRPWMGAAVRYFYYAREAKSQPTGLGRWANGKWTFPAAPLPKPDAKTRGYAFFSEGVGDMAAVGNQLVYCGPKAVFVGPEPWKPIVEGDIVGIRSADGGKAVAILRHLVPAVPGDPIRFERAVYRGVAEPLDFQPLTRDETNSPSKDSFWEYQAGDTFAASNCSDGSWVRLPIPGSTTWVVGPGIPWCTVLVTKQAYWLVGGMVIRLDRAAVDAMAK